MIFSCFTAILKEFGLKMSFFRNEKTLRKLSIEAITARALMKILWRVYFKHLFTVKNKSQKHDFSNVSI